METLQRMLAIFLADLRERTRTTRFWIAIATVGLATWWFFPDQQSGLLAVSIDQARGEYSSAWLGLCLGLVYSTVLAWLGFYLVRGTLVRDFDTRVWQLLVTTPMTRAGYLLAKWTSHMVVFSLVLLVGLVVALVAQWVRAEDRALDPIELLKPVLFLTLPALSLTAFFAILFDMVPPLRRAGGNVVFFFVWLLLFSAFAIPLDPDAAAWARETWFSDPSGVTLVQRHLLDVLPALAPGVDASQLSVGMTVAEGPVRLFEWTHWSISTADMFGRWLWVSLSLIATAALAPALDRAAGRTSARQSAVRTGGKRLRWLDLALSRLENGRRGRLVAAEIRLSLRQKPTWWWLALPTAWAVQLTAPASVANGAAIVAWMISIDLLGRGLLRERETHTTSLVMTAPDASSQLLFARTVSSVAMALVSVAPLILRAAGAASSNAALLLLVALNVALLGLALAALCRSSRLYEIVMLLMAYAGLQGAGPLAADKLSGSMLAVHVALLPGCILILMLAFPSLNAFDSGRFRMPRRADRTS